MDARNVVGHGQPPQLGPSEYEYTSVVPSVPDRSSGVAND
jgi:hypothetical protein